VRRFTNTRDLESVPGGSFRVFLVGTNFEQVLESLITGKGEPVLLLA
jgi:hypothetical protein